MKYKIRFYLFLILILYQTVKISSLAQQSFLLKEAIIYAFEHNNDIKAQEFFLSTKNSDIKITKSDLLPKIRIEEGYMNTNNPTEAFSYRINQQRVVPSSLLIPNLNDPTPINNWLTGLYLEQAIYDKRLGIRVNMSKTEYSSQLFDYLRKREELAQNVALAYFDVDRDAKIVKIAEKNIEDSQKNLNDAKKRYSTQTSFYSAVLRAETDLTEAKQILVSSQKNLEIAKRALGLALGETKSIEINTENNPQLTLKENNYYDTSSTCRNDIKSSELVHEKSQKNLKLAEATYWPTMVLASSYRTWDSSVPFGWGGHNYFVGSFLRWDMIDGGKRKNEKIKAQDIVGQTCQSLEGLKKKVSFQVFAAYMKAEESAANLKLAQETEKTAQEGRDIVRDKYEKGILKLIDLLDTQRNLNLARINSIVQENNCTDSLIRLSYESGTILKDLEIYQNQDK